MASSQKILPVGVWVKITDSDKEGSIRHQSGNTLVVYLESPIAPVGFDEDTPISGRTKLGEERPYYGVSSTDFIYARATKADAKLTLTPKGE